MLCQILLPKGQPFNPASMGGLVKTLADRLADSQMAAEFSIEATTDGIRFCVATGLRVSLEQIAAMVNSFYPGAVVQPHPSIPVIVPAKTRVLLVLRAYNLPVDAVQLPLGAFRVQTDPLVPMVQAMSSLEEGEFLEYMVICGEAMKPKMPFWAKVTLAMLDEYQRQNSPVQYSVRKMQEDKRREVKRKQALYHVFVALKMTTRNKERFHLLSTAASTLRFMADDLYPLFDDMVAVDFDTQTWDDFNTQTWALAGQQVTKEQDNRSAFALLPDELATMWHLPHQGMENTKVQWATTMPSELVVEEKLDPKYCRIGKVESKTVALSRKDRRYHSYVTGRTGMGKSTFLHNLIDEDIQAGCGVAVIDPHGALIKDIFKAGIPPAREADVVLLECGNTEYPVPLNPLRTPEGISQETVFTTVMWILQSIYAKQWSSTRMETTFRNILQVILTDPQATPLDIQEVIINPNYRRKKVAERTPDLSRAARNWWNLFDEASGSEQRSQTQSVLSRLTAFLGTAHIERMTCHPHAIDFRALIRDKKIVLIDLSGDAIGTEVDSLGAIFLAQFYLSSLSLGDVPGSSEPRFFLYVDEVQRFITSSLPDMFSEARKFGLSLTLANQYINQLDAETSEGILKNVGTKISFACHDSEAAATHKMYAPDVEREALTKLNVGQAAVATMFEGRTQPAFIVQAYSPLPASENPIEIAVYRKQTRDYLGIIPANQVNQWIDSRYDSDLFKKPPVDTGLSDYDREEA